jgi:hypothetical protein
MALVDDLEGAGIGTGDECHELLVGELAQIGGACEARSR